MPHNLLKSVFVPLVGWLEMVGFTVRGKPPRSGRFASIHLRDI